MSFFKALFTIIAVVLWGVSFIGLVLLAISLFTGSMDFFFFGVIATFGAFIPAFAITIFISPTGHCSSLDYHWF